MATEILHVFLLLATRAPSSRPTNSSIRVVQTLNAYIIVHKVMAVGNDNNITMTYVTGYLIVTNVVGLVFYVAVVIAVVVLASAS